MAEEFFIQGNEACAKGAIAAGCRFFAGYPITPSTEVAETLARELPKVGRNKINDSHFRSRYFINAGKYRLCIHDRDSNSYC